MEEIVPPSRLLDRVKLAPRVRHYSLQTEEAYVATRSTSTSRRFLGSEVRLFDHLTGTPALLGNPTVIPVSASHTALPSTQGIVRPYSFL
ncbi:MAG TPA: hypothetical protein VLU46_16925, partial [Thermoanaerobaculia bacterium]|nr:hypothetical protein [Thermoanaerobaculia bacterium]